MLSKGQMRVKIGCGWGLLNKLIKENPPIEGDTRVQTADVNGILVMHYTTEYCARIKAIYAQSKTSRNVARPRKPLGEYTIDLKRKNRAEVMHLIEEMITKLDGYITQRPNNITGDTLYQIRQRKTLLQGFLKQIQESSVINKAEFQKLDSLMDDANELIDSLE